MPSKKGSGRRTRAQKQAIADRRRQATQQQQQQSSIQIAAQQVLETYSGPIPPPSMLREYNEVSPGSAERVLAQFEGQSKHRQEMERIVITGNRAAQARGAWLGFFLSLAVLGLAAYIANLGYGTVAGLMAGGDLATLAGVFVYAKVDQRRERDEKFELMYGRPRR